MTCPAGRARCARGGHFVAGCTLSGRGDLLGSPVGRNLGCNALLGTSYLEGVHDAVGDGGGFDGRADVVGADDVGAG